MSRLEIIWIDEKGCEHYRIKDHFTGKVIHCNKGELNEIIWKLLGV